MGATQTANLNCVDGYKVQGLTVKHIFNTIVSYRMLYVRNASGLVSDGARLLHNLVILFIAVWMSKRTINRIVVQYSGSEGRKDLWMMSRNICSKTIFQKNDRDSMLAFVNGFIFYFILTSCYFIARKSRYLYCTKIKKPKFRNNENCDMIVALSSCAKSVSGTKSKGITKGISRGKSSSI